MNLWDHMSWCFFLQNWSPHSRTCKFLLLSPLLRICLPFIMYVCSFSARQMAEPGGDCGEGYSVEDLCKSVLKLIPLTWAFMAPYTVQRLLGWGGLCCPYYPGATQRPSLLKGSSKLESLFPLTWLSTLPVPCSLRVASVITSHGDWCRQGLSPIRLQCPYGWAPALTLLVAQPNDKRGAGRTLGKNSGPWVRQTQEKPSPSTPDCVTSGKTSGILQGSFLSCKMGFWYYYPIGEGQTRHKYEVGWVHGKPLTHVTYHHSVRLSALPNRRSVAE